MNSFGCGPLLRMGNEGDSPTMCPIRQGSGATQLKRYPVQVQRRSQCKDGVFSNSQIHHEFDMSHNQSLTSNSFSPYQLGYKFDEFISSERKNFTYRLKLEGRGAYHLDGILSLSLMLKSHCEMAPTRSTSLNAVATNTSEPFSITPSWTMPDKSYPSFPMLARNYHSSAPPLLC